MVHGRREVSEFWSVLSEISVFDSMPAAVKQSGDLGDGTGGTSIWGDEFADEIVDDLRHDRCVSFFSFVSCLRAVSQTRR